MRYSIKLLENFKVYKIISFLTVIFYSAFLKTLKGSDFLSDVFNLMNVLIKITFLRLVLKLEENISKFLSTYSKLCDTVICKCYL